MSEYFAIFQIGPVQEFIKTARKTIDYWSGSFLLSYLSATAIQSLGQKNVVFPSVNGNPLYDEVTRQKSKIPWDKNLNIRDEAYFPTLPNRIFCISENDPSKELEQAKQVVLKQWIKIVEAVCKRFPKSLKNKISNSSSEWKKIWKRQVSDPFEILYVWRMKQNGETYGEAYKKTENLMGMRKVSRWFGAGEPEPGHKCSLCGIREALHFASDSPKRSEIRKEWNEDVRTDKLKFKFRDGETLCAVCMVKRLAPEYAFRNKKGVPSTSTVAVGKTVWDVLENLNQKGLSATKVEEFANKVKAVAGKCGEAAESRLLPRVENSARDKKLHRILNIDGDWFFTEFYQKLAFDHSVIKGKIQATQKHLTEKILKPLKDILGRQGYLDPCKYYAVVVADGDSMGEKLANIKNRDDHEKLSRYIAQFSLNEPARIFEQEHLGFVVYFGGDEGVAFVALEDLFISMKKLREAWEEEVIEVLKNDKIEAPTLSIGVAIAHHQEGLRGVIERAFAALEEAKRVRVDAGIGNPPKKKDAFGIYLSRRSSGKDISRVQWRMDGGTSVLDCLEDLKELYRNEELSWAWIERIYAERKAIGDPPKDLPPNDFGDWIDDAPEFCRFEIERLMLRHKKEAASGRQANTVIRMVCDLHDNFKNLGTSTDDYGHERFQNFFNLMDLAKYVAKGGGK